MVKENNSSRTTLSQRQVLLCGIVVLCVLVGYSMSRESVLEEANVGSTRRKKKSKVSKKSSALQKPPPKVKRNVYGNRLCLLSDELLYGSQPIHMAHVDAPLPIRFQCSGDAYEVFGTKLEHLVKERTTTSSTSTASWGKRNQPIPARAAGEELRHILVFGSSHLRQVLAALVCQYNDQVVSVQKIQGTTKYSLNSFAIRIRLQQNIYIWAVINPPYIYTPEWQKYLENHVLQMPLAIMDLVVMNPFHHFHQGTHAQAYLEFLQDHDEADGAESQVVNVDPPSFLDLTEAYSGPIIYVGSFAEYGFEDYELVVEQITALREGEQPPPDEKTRETLTIDWEFADTTSAAAQHHHQGISKQAESMFTYKPPPPKIHGLHQRRPRRRLEEEDYEEDEKDYEEGEEEAEGEQEADAEPVEPRTNLLAINGRQYVAQLGECATDTHQTVHTCITDVNHHRYSQGHRCFGSKGGHPDLISYDLIEAMHQLLPLH